jgi:hypothetical protein
VRGGVVLLGIGREADEMIGGVVGHRNGRLAEAERAGRSGKGERRDRGQEGDHETRHPPAIGPHPRTLEPRLDGGPGYTAGRARL